jgi:hypothetical protein
MAAQEITVEGYRIIVVDEDTALVSSKSEKLTWHVVRGDSCDCRGFIYRRMCTHTKLLLAVQAPVAVRRAVAQQEQPPLYPDNAMSGRIPATAKGCRMCGQSDPTVGMLKRGLCLNCAIYGPSSIVLTA